jgi:hypothetical protein
VDVDWIEMVIYNMSHKIYVVGMWKHSIRCRTKHLPEIQVESDLFPYDI